MTHTHTTGKGRNASKDVQVNGRRTQQERTEDSTARILSAAMELIGERGYQGTTLTDIGRRAGVSRGLVTYHFGTKEACIREMLERIRTNTRVFAEVEQSGKVGLAALDQLLEGYLRGYLARLPGSRAIFVAMVESFSSTPDLIDLMRQNDDHFRAVVTEHLTDAAEQGEVSSELSLEPAAAMIVGLVRGIALQWLVNEDAVDVGRLLPSLLRTVRQAVQHSA